VGEDVYALPRDVSNLVIYYNKSLFRKYGVPYPSCDWTLDDLLKVSKRLTHRGVWAISYEPTIDYSLPYMYYMGGGILSENMDLIVNSDNSMSGIKFYKDLAYKYHYAPLPFQTGSKTLAQMFLEGRICMHLSGRWLVPKYRECAKFEWDIVNFPKYTSCCDASGWAVSKSSRHKNSAKKFVLFLSSKENISKMTKSGLITPARLDVSHSDVFLSGEPKSSQLFLESIKYSKNRPVSKNYNKLIDQLNDELFAGDD
jgi:multiple sugar transport system substrate-binding protein